MTKTYKAALGIFLLLVAFLTYIEAVEPEPLNWNPSYSSKDKIPMGTYVLHDNIKSLFEETVLVSKTPYEFLTSKFEIKGSYIFINSQLAFDDDELNLLLKWVEKGNQLFLASDAFSKNLLDTLQLNVATAVPDEGFSSKPMVNLVQTELKGENAFLFDKETYHSVFSEFDSINHNVLGISELYSADLEIKEPEVNFVKVKHGEGDIFLHSTPQAFTNFFLLDENNFEYLEGALAYLQTENILYWDEYKKIGKTFQTSPLYILMGNKALKWAYYFVLLGVLLFIIFEGKRKQRAIPVIIPLENQTYHFTRTIAGLYLDQKDYKAVANKKIGLFLEYVRIHYRLQTSSINEKFFEDLSVQSGKSLEEVKQLFHIIREIETKTTIKKEELLELNSSIDLVKNK